MTKIIRTKALNRYPGDVAVKLTKAATSQDGRQFPAGTVFGCILCSGIDNTLPGSPAYVEVTLGPQGRAKFVGPRRH